MNDALRTNLFIRFSPETVAAACIYLAARVRRVPLPNRPHWFELFGKSEQELREIATLIMSLYRRAKPNAEVLERAVEELRTRQQERRLKNKLLSGTNTPQGASNFSPQPSQPNSPAEPAAAGSGGRDTPNGEAKVNKENLGAAARRDDRDSSRSRSSNEDADRRKLKSKNGRRDRSRHHSRSRSPDKRRRHSSTPDRHRTKHKKDKDRSRDKHRRRSADRTRGDRSRSPVRSKSKHERSKRRDDSYERDRRAGKADKKRGYENNHKRR